MVLNLHKTKSIPRNKCVVTWNRQIQTVWWRDRWTVNREVIPIYQPADAADTKMFLLLNYWTRMTIPYFNNGMVKPAIPTTPSNHNSWILLSVLMNTACIMYKTVWQCDLHSHCPTGSTYCILLQRWWICVCLLLAEFTFATGTNFDSGLHWHSVWLFYCQKRYEE